MRPARAARHGGGGCPAHRRVDPRGLERRRLEAEIPEGKLAHAQAAMETSVAEAEKELEGLAEAGHLEVRGCGLFYAQWETGEGVREIEDW